MGFLQIDTHEDEIWAWTILMKFGGKKRQREKLVVKKGGGKKKGRE